MPLLKTTHHPSEQSILAYNERIAKLITYEMNEGWCIVSWLEDWCMHVFKLALYVKPNFVRMNLNPIHWAIIVPALSREVHFQMAQEGTAHLR
jgi:hypothetical protein